MQGCNFAKRSSQKIRHIRSSRLHIRIRRYPLSQKDYGRPHNLIHTGLNSISLMDSTCANMHWANCTFLKVWSHSRRRHHTPLNSLAVVNLVALSDHKFGGCPLNRSLSLLGSLSLSKFAYDDSFEKIILTSQAICPTRF
jgi:hypothetical protein